MSDRIIKLPDIGEGITEAEIVEWLIGVGDDVEEDQTLGSVMTDKAAVEIPAPVSGVITALGGEVGDVLAVGAEFARIRMEGSAATAAEDAEPAAHPPTEPDGTAADIAVPDRSRAEAGESGDAPGEREAALAERDRPPVDLGPDDNAGAPDATVSKEPASRGDSAAEARARPLASPAVRRRAYEHGVPLRYVRGSGPAGRISHEDLDAYIASAKGASAVAPAHGDQVEQIRVVGMRRQIARKMQTAKRRIAHFTYVEETDVTALEELREQLNARRSGKHARLTLLPFIVMAMVRSLEEFPQMNARYDDEAEVIHRHSGNHIGVATQTDNGLMVPVIRHAEALDIWGLSGEIRRLAESARAGKSARDELDGGTITLTSLGALGGLVSTPIINHPEVAIVGVNRIVTRPMFVDDRIQPRKLMNLSSSFDHRIIDGHEAARFVQLIRSYVEFPSTLFIRD